MLPYVVIGALLSLPFVLGLVFRVSTSHLFFSLMAGELLAHYFGEDVGLIVSSVTKSSAADYAEVAVLLIPMLLTALFLKGTVSKGKIIFHTVPLLVTGIVLAAFALQMLPPIAQAEIQKVEIGQRLMNTSTAIIGGVVVLQLVSLWLLNRSHGEHKKHKG